MNDEALVLAILVHACMAQRAVHENVECVVPVIVWRRHDCDTSHVVEKEHDIMFSCIKTRDGVFRLEYSGVEILSSMMAEKPNMHLILAERMN